MVKAPVPVIAAPIEMVSVVTVRLLAPMAIVPAEPVEKEEAVMVVLPSTLTPPTAPLNATLEVPGLTETVRAEELS